nr:PREDICTED: rootletin-like [Bemisia tabaci]
MSESRESDNLSYLPARSRAPVYLPKGVDLASGSPSPASVSDTEADATDESAPDSLEAHQTPEPVEPECQRPGPPATATPTTATSDMSRLQLRKDGASRRPLSFTRQTSSRPREVSGSSGSGGKMEEEREPLHHQNQQLRRQLEEESATYKRRLDTYKQAQQHQAALVSRLQAKVLQYKQRCAELEERREEPITRLEVAHKLLHEQEERVQDLETALLRLNEEKRRTDKLLELNQVLEAQLDEAHQSNETLTMDLQKLTADWESMRDELALKEEEWKEEELYFSEYCATEHSRLLNVWRDIVSFKRQFTEIQVATERDLVKLRNDIVSSNRELVGTCSSIVTSTRLSAVSGEKQQQHLTVENSELRSKLTSIRSEHEALMNELKVKEERVQQLLREMSSLVSSRHNVYLYNT